MTRQLNYISPTSYTKWVENQKEFYRIYLADKRTPRPAQLQVMSVGSSFDAYVKSKLHLELFGKTKNQGSKFEFQTLFESQVEEQNRKWAKDAGFHVYMHYIDCGAYNDLLMDLQSAQTDPHFEDQIQATVKYNGREVPLLGKPDLYFLNSEGAPVIIDWKVNGYLSKSNISPTPGYIRIRDGNNNNRGAHKEALLTKYKGMTINKNFKLERIWAVQTSIYGWVVQCGVGEPFVAGIDQVVCKPNFGPDKLPTLPDLRTAQHRYIMDSKFQINLFEHIADMWEIINSDHIFRDMKKEDSQALCKRLDNAEIHAVESVYL